MTTLTHWAEGLTNSELITEFIQLYDLVEIAECYNSKDLMRLIAVERELNNRGAAPSIKLILGGIHAEEELPETQRATPATP